MTLPLAGCIGLLDCIEVRIDQGVTNQCFNFSVPRVSLPEVSLFPLMIKDALIIAFISYVIALSLGKTFGRRNRYNVDANQVM